MIDYDRIREFYERHRSDQSDDPDFLRSTVDESLGIVRFRNRAEARHLDRVLAIEPGDRVLDLGAGTGRYAVYFAARGAHVTAIEIAPSLAEVARRNASRRGLTLDYRIGSLLDPPLAADERFDLVHIGGVLVYINDADLGRVREVVVAHTQPSATLLLREPVDPHGPSEQVRGADYHALFRKPEAYVDTFTPAFRLLYERSTVSHLLPRGSNTQGVVKQLGKSAAWKRWLVDHALPPLAFADYALLDLEERWRSSALAGLLGDPGVLQHFYVFTRQA